MNIIITMAGASKRFFDEGYTKPKYMLTLNGGTVFESSILRFKSLFNKANFNFVIRDIYNTKEFVIEQCKLMGLLKYQVICLETLSEGQAETVYISLKLQKEILNKSILISNIDTFSKPFTFSDDMLKADGFLEVFSGQGLHWSFAKTLKNSTKVTRTAEKERISEYCSTGVYYFKRAATYMEAFEDAIKYKQKRKNEYYVAPLYNYLIDLGLNIRIVKRELTDLSFCGTPNEYKLLMKKA